MSVNTSHTPDGRGVLLFQGEGILVYCKKVDMLFEANSNPVFDRKTLSGAVYLTTHRVIFMNQGAGNLRSFTMPFFCMRNVRLEQPVFGANYMKGTALAQDGGNFQGDVLWRMTFPKGGCIEFGQALLRATDMASYVRPFNAPPPYVPTNAGYQYQAPPCYSPNNPEFQRAANTFREPPPNVYVYEQPPPYPGIFSDAPQQPPQSYANNAPYPAGQVAPGNLPYPAGPTPYPNPPYPTGQGATPYPTEVRNPGIPCYPDLSNTGPITAYPMSDGLHHRNVPTAPPHEPPPPYEAPPLPPKA
uniref:GRAM domain-containing protein n=1 Tax=Panagrolaimus sp. JU765 TaxID=591449 RepID=A0AC34QT17_9BILA